MGKVLALALLSILLGLSTVSAARAGGFQLAPAEACDLLADQRLRTRGGNGADGGEFQCRSQRRPLTGGGEPNNSLRYVARGAEGRVDSLTLELQVNSTSAVQRAHRQLVDVARTLFDRALHQPLPEEIEAAILSAVRGDWTVNGNKVTLQRIVLGGAGYELRLRIE